MNYFIAYRHTGEEPTRLSKLLPEVKNSLEERGSKIYCTYFDENSFRSNGYKPKDIMEHAFNKIEELGALFVVQDSSQKSEGMLMEIGFCVAKKLPVVVAKRSGVDNSYLSSMASYSFEYEDVVNLKEKITNAPRKY